MADTFDPNAASSEDSGIFGLPYSYEKSQVVYLPVPWEVTTSYGGGTSDGPSAILAASRQVDLFDAEVQKPYEVGLHMLIEDSEIREWNGWGKLAAQKIIERGGNIAGDEDLERDLSVVNDLGVKLNVRVEECIRKILRDKKIPALVGGDHSTPFGAFKAIADEYPGVGILHFDAHSDTRIAFEGFQWSHASIMHNVLTKIPGISKLVQVGIRDFCEQEHDFCASQGARVHMFTDLELARLKIEGTPWAQIAKRIVDALPEKVWISFDIDGLDPRYCPHTGTPVPGGLEFSEANYVFALVAKSGRKIVGFDVNEVAPDPEGNSEWDANVGSRLLYKLTAWTLVSQGLRKTSR